MEARIRDNRTTFGETIQYHKRMRTTVTKSTGNWLSPEAKWRKKWDVMQAVVLFYLAIVVPLRVGFDQQTDGAAYMFDLCIDIYFWVDIAFNFIFAYENNEGVVIYDLGMI